MLQIELVIKKVFTASLTPEVMFSMLRLATEQVDLSYKN